MPPTPSIGRIATTSTMMPMPPYQLRAWRQRLTEGGRWSSPTRTVAPVVLSPDIVSKNASVNVSPGIAISSGTVAIADISTQARLTSRKPSRERSSRLWRRVVPWSSAPAARLASAAITKSIASPSR